MFDKIQDMTPQPASLIAALVVIGMSLAWPYIRSKKATAPVSGKVTPEATTPFVTPKPQPLPDFDLTNDPEKHRPCRHGPNHVTMGIRKLNWNEWIQLDSNYMRYHDLKAAQLASDTPAHVDYVDNAVTRDACFELLEELISYLTHRYPKIFQLRGNSLKNCLTGETFTYPARTPTEALSTAALLVQDDLVLMVKNDDGQYHLDAGAVCLPGFWRLREKFRTSLDELHINAKVPHYERTLKKSMNRFFEKLQPEAPVTRNNFFIQLDDGLHWSHRMGDKDGLEESSWATANAAGLTVDEIHFRSERQTLRRLPRSKALMFTIRTYFEPVTRISKEPHVPGRLAESIRAWDDTVSTYKGKKHWEGLLLPYLDEQHKLQQDSGVLESQPEGDFPY